MILLRQRLYSKIPKAIPIPKNKEQALEAINKGRIKLLESAVNIERYATTHTPGQLAETVGQKFVEAPVATAGTIGGYASIPYVGYIPGTTWASVSLEALARRWEAYKKLIKNLKGAYTDAPHELVGRAGTCLVKIRDKIYRVTTNPDFVHKMMYDNIKREGIKKSEKVAEQIGRVLPEKAKGITIKRIVRSAGDAMPALA